MMRTTVGLAALALLGSLAVGCDRTPDTRVVTLPEDVASSPVARDPDPSAFCDALGAMNASFASMEANAGDAAALQVEVNTLVAAVTDARISAPQDLQEAIDDAAPVYIRASQQAADGVDYRETLNEHWNANEDDFQAIQAFAQENGCF